MDSVWAAQGGVTAGNDTHLPTSETHKEDHSSGVDRIETSILTHEREFKGIMTLESEILLWFCRLHPKERATALSCSSGGPVVTLRNVIYRYRKQMQRFYDVLVELRESGRAEVVTDTCIIYGEVRYDTAYTFCPKIALHRIRTGEERDDIPHLDLEAYAWNGEVNTKKRYSGEENIFYNECVITWTEEEDYRGFRDRRYHMEVLEQNDRDAWDLADQTATI